MTTGDALRVCFDVLPKPKILILGKMSKVTVYVLIFCFLYLLIFSHISKKRENIFDEILKFFEI